MTSLRLAIAGFIACQLAACAPHAQPNSPRLDIESEVRTAFASSLNVLRSGSPQQMLATVADNFVMKTPTELLTREVAVRHLPSDREILSFDKVTSDSVVVTSDDLNERFVEIWVRTATGWRLARVNQLDSYSRGS
jgi:hypothetical protein